MKTLLASCVPASVLFVTVLFVTNGCSQRPQEIAPDFEVDFSCHGSPDEGVIEDFARRRGFDVLNEERARRERERGFFPLEIDSYDAHRRMFDVVGLREPPSRGGSVHFRLTILGPPPTVHDRALERAALGLVQDTLRCRVELVRSFANGTDGAVLFDRIFKDEQRRMAEFGLRRRMP